MLRQFLRSKIHRVRITEANVDYVGSLSIDEDLMKLADLADNELVHVANLTNGERLVTYAIPAPAGSRTICSNGAAAHKMRVGDLVIIMAYALCSDNEVGTLEPRIVIVDEFNEPVEKGH